MRARAAAGLLSLAFLACGARPAAADDEPSFAALWLDAGPSFDRAQLADNGRNGYGLAGGVHLGRGVAFTLGAAVEHYPFDGEPRLVTTVGSGGPDTLRREGGGNKTVGCLTAGMRLTRRADRFEPFFEVALGMASVASNLPRHVDPTTGATVYPSTRYEWSGVAVDLGVGVRTRRQKSFDWMVGLRYRTYTQIFEGSSGASIQARVGVICPSLAADHHGSGRFREGPAGSRSARSRFAASRSGGGG